MTLYEKNLRTLDGYYPGAERLIRDAAAEAEDYVPFARTLDRAAKACGVDFIGGFSALVQKGMTDADRILIASIPEPVTSAGSGTRRNRYGCGCGHWAGLRRTHRSS